MAGDENERKTARQAAIEVLDKAGEPLRVKEIAKQVLEVEGVSLAGKTARRDGRGDARSRE